MLPRIIALFGLLFPNGIYIYWLASKFDSFAEAAQNELAVGFLLVTFVATLLVANQFRTAPLGRVPVRWFVVLSMAGGLGFAIPFFYWLNKRECRRKDKKTAEVRQTNFNDSINVFVTSEISEPC